MGCRIVENSDSHFWSPHRFMKCCKARSMGTILWLYHSSVSKETKHLHSSSELSSNPFWKWDVAAFALLVIAFLQFSLANLFPGESVHWNPRLKHSRMGYHFTKGTKKCGFPRETQEDALTQLYGERPNKYCHQCPHCTSFWGSDIFPMALVKWDWLCFKALA